MTIKSLIPTGLSLLLSLAVFTGCNNAPKEKSNPIQQESPPPGLNIEGKVTSIEDVGYPMFVLKVENEDTTQEFLLNIESINMQHGDAYSLKTSTVHIDYRLKEEPFVDDILYQGESILGVYAPNSHEESLHIEGVLSGAEEASQGDLPGSFTVSPSDDPSMTFEFYIDEELSALNNKVIEVYYSIREVPRITQLKLL